MGHKICRLEPGCHHRLLPQLLLVTLTMLATLRPELRPANVCHLSATFSLDHSPLLTRSLSLPFSRLPQALGSGTGKSNQKEVPATCCSSERWVVELVVRLSAPISLLRTDTHDNAASSRYSLSLSLLRTHVTFFCIHGSPAALEHGIV